jgi:FdhD protein
MPTAAHTSFVEVRRVNGELAAKSRDEVAVEEPLEIQIGLERRGIRTTRSVSVTMRTPGHDAELAIGFLFGEGILNRRSDVSGIEFPALGAEELNNRVRIQLSAGISLDFKQLERHFFTTSSCGICGKASLEAVQRLARGPALCARNELRTSSAMIHRLPAQLRAAQQIFEHTGGLHAAALFDVAANLCSVREDVGRHNAVDKVIGAEWLEGRMPLGDRILFVSGRASFELIQKAARAGIPIFAAVGAPSSLAVELAEACGMTLLGFVRDARFNIYSAGYRLERMGQNSEVAVVS